MNMADNTAASKRAERLAAALRSNLQRRKGRDREEAALPDTLEEPSSSTPEPLPRQP